MNHLRHVKDKTITCTTPSKLTKFQQASQAWSLSRTSTQTFNITRTLQNDDNDDGDDKDDDEGDSFNQKADDDAGDFDEGCLISRKRNFPLRASLNVRHQMSSLRGRHQSMEKTSLTQNGSSRSHSIQKRQWPKVANHLCCTCSRLLPSKHVALLSIDVLCIRNYKLINLNYCSNTSWYGKKFEKCAEIQRPIGHRSSAILTTRSFILNFPHAQ